MKSCWRETISGIGTVIVGSEQSSVHLADFKTERCPAIRARRSASARSSARAPPPLVRSLKDDTKKGPPPLVLHGQSPIVATSERGKLVVERLDVKGERYEVDLTGAQPRTASSTILPRATSR